MLRLLHKPLFFTFTLTHFRKRRNYICGRTTRTSSCRSCLIPAWHTHYAPSLGLSMIILHAPTCKTHSALSTNFTSLTCSAIFKVTFITSLSTELFLLVNELSKANLSTPTPNLSSLETNFLK